MSKLTTWNCFSLTGGSWDPDAGVRDLDGIPKDDINDLDRALVITAAAGMIVMEYDASATDAEEVAAHPFKVRPDDYVDAGVWIEKEPGIPHSLATAANDFLVASGAGVFEKQTLAQVKATLSLGSAAYLDIDTDGALAANSDTKIATQKAVKTYVDGIGELINALQYKGAIDCAANPNYPAANAGHVYIVSVAGKIGGASGPSVVVGNLLLCRVDSSGAGDHATVGANWNIIEESGAYATTDHDATHIRAGSDEIDGDKLDIDWTPANYTPAVVTEADNVDHLAAHLKGLDNAIRAMVYGVSWDESADTYVRTGVLAAEACGASPGNAKLPIQRQMKRCIVDDNGDVVYYLDPDDSRNQAGVQPTVTGTDDVGTASKVSDVGVFTGVAAEYVGKYVHNTTDDTYALITAKDSDDVLSISADIMDIDETFEICTAVLDGTDGQVMVEIPKFFFKYSYGGTVHTWEISNVQLPGFEVHPAFVRAGVEVPHRYMGAYEGFKDGSNVLSSESGRAPAHTATRANFRTYAAARGTGWSQQDFYLSSAIQLLYLIEYADFDSQTMIGEGNTKYAAWPGSPPSTTGLSNGDGNGTNNVSTAGGAATDYMTYRGIENFYGHIWKFVDGINFNNNVPYVCQDPADFADDTVTAYTSLGVTLAASDNYQNTLEQISGGFLPASVGAPGSSSTKICDYYYQAAGWRVCLLGGRAINGLDAGAFCWGANNDSGSSGTYIGGRLCFKRR